MLGLSVLNRHPFSMIEIRPALKTDASILTELGRKTFEETFSKDNRKEDMDSYLSETFSVEKQLQEILDPNRKIALAWFENQAAGFYHLLKAQPDPCVHGVRPIELLRLYVDSRFQGQRVGFALMESAVQIARAEGFQTLWLGVWERNYKAQAFYKKFGFGFVGQHVFRLGEDEQIDLVMAREI